MIFIPYRVYFHKPHLLTGTSIYGTGRVCICKLYLDKFRVSKFSVLFVHLGLLVIKQNRFYKIESFHCDWIQWNLLKLAAGPCGWMACNQPLQKHREGEMVLETLVHSSFNHLTQLLTWRSFIEKISDIKFWTLLCIPPELANTIPESVMSNKTLCRPIITLYLKYN